MSQRRRINSWALLRSGVLSNTRLQQIHEFSKFTERLTHDSNQWRFQIARGQRRRHCVLLDYLALRGIDAATDFLQWLRQSLQLRLEKKQLLSSCVLGGRDAIVSHKRNFAARAASAHYGAHLAQHTSGDKYTHWHVHVPALAGKCITRGEDGVSVT